MSTANSNKKKKKSPPTTASVVRLDAHPQAGRLRVDRTFPGRIHAASILTTGPALGHDFDVDRTTVEQLAGFASGMSGRWTHGNLCEDGLGRHLGRWSNVQVETTRLCRTCAVEAQVPTCPTCNAATDEATRAVGDFAFAASAHKLRPDGLDVPAPEYLMDRAEEDPSSFGVSIVARFAFEEQEEEASLRSAGDGGGGRAPAVPGAEEPPRRVARLESKDQLLRGDWVADPAANPIGLHAGTGVPSELAEAATRGLDQVVAKEGRERAKGKALAFLARYFKDDLTSAEREDHALAQLEAEVATLRIRVEAFEKADKARQTKDHEAFLERLRKESALAQAPIPEADVARVANLLNTGQVEAAKVVGEAFLTRSRAQGQGAFQRPVVPLGPTETPTDAVEATAAAQAQLLRCAHWTVALNQQGTAITQAVPPGGR